MSILCCHIPDFLIRLTQREADSRRESASRKPVVLLDDEERVCAASAEAARDGVLIGMRPAMALMRCPDAAFRPLDAPAARAANDALIETLAAWELPVEASAWGSAYIDMRQIEAPSDQPSAQSVCGDLGRRVRRVLGEALQPALGWDSSKFTARAAAFQAAPGTMRLVGEAQEERFLSPLSLSLLPLPAAALQQLSWLGIRTLGQFARLPGTAVQQRFGRVGTMAQAWARGKDRRPVVPTLQRPPDEIEVEFDMPVTSTDVIVDALERPARAVLARLKRQTEGCRRLRLRLRLLDDARMNIEHSFITPTHHWTRMRHALARAMESRAMESRVMESRGGQKIHTGVTGASVALLDVAEIAPEQLRLFDWGDGPKSAHRSDDLIELSRAFGARFGEVFAVFDRSDPTHPIPERRFGLARVGALAEG